MSAGVGRLSGPPPDVTLSYSMATLTIRLPDDLRRELLRLSKERRRPAGEIVRDSLRRYLAVERFRALRERTLPFAEAQGLLTDEDVFKIVS
jgi:predicted transcriptional regulator